VSDLEGFREFMRDEHDLDVPVKKAVCPRCHGNGISGDDECWQDEDFTEAYFGGRYDIVCEECHGRNVVDEIDYERIDRRVYDEWESRRDEMYDLRQTERMERMMGA